MSNSKSVFMSEAEIHHFEQMDDRTLEQNLSAKEFQRLLRSYRLAANVANAAWLVMKNLDEVEGFNDELDGLATKLREALSEYAPKHFPRMQPETLDALERMYDIASHRPDVPPDFLDWFFNAIMGLREAELA